MDIALLKLVDLGFRFVFVFGALYLLPVRQAGQFGALNALIAYYVFFVGFERYGVIQRQVAAARDQGEVATAMRAAIQFFAVNHLGLVAVFLASAAWSLGLSWRDVGLLAAIAVSEHIAVDSYRVALIAPAFRSFLFVAACRNGLITMLGLLWLVAVGRQGFDLDAVLRAWALGSAGGIIAFAIAVRRVFRLLPEAQAPAQSALEFLGQYRASATHFGIGLLALCSAQLDRLVVGAVSNLETAGVYFKNLFLAATVYQATTVLMQNRLLPAIYREIALKSPRVAAAVVARASVRVAAVYGVVIVLGAAVLHQFRDAPMLLRQGLRPELVGLLLVAYLLRAIGDFNCIYLNAASDERFILLTHGLAVGVGVCANLVLTPNFGVVGTVWSVVLGSGVFLIVSRVLRMRTYNRLVTA